MFLLRLGLMTHVFNCIFVLFQDRNSLGNGLDMRTLEHCLSDIMRGVGDGGPPDHLKGK